MAKITQLMIQVENKPGSLAHICSALAKVAVNITAVMASQDEKEGIRIVATPHATAKKVLDGLKIPYREEDAVAARLSDRPGALGKATRKLADKGININYAYGSIVKGEGRALIILGVSDVNQAADLV
ncbi:MAG: ACT domain-containing protein [Terriglobales bacterium]